MKYAIQINQAVIFENDLPQNLTQYTLTITEDMIRESGICPLVFVRELGKCFYGELEESPKKNQV